MSSTSSKVDTTASANTLSESNSVVCPRCNCESTLPELFVCYNVSPVCPKCALEIRTQQSALAKNWLLYFGVGVIFIFWALITGGNSLYVSLNLLVFCFSFYPLLLLHELAHAIATWIVGGHVFAIHWGIGRLLFRQRLAALYISVSRFPILGFCVCACPTTNLIRLRYAGIVAAAPLFHLLLFIILLPDAAWQNVSITFAWREIFLLPNFILLLFSLYPRWILFDSNRVASDGQQLVLLWLQKLAIAELHGWYYVHHTSYAILDRNFEQAMKWCRLGLKLYPDNPQLQSHYAYLLMQSDQYEEAASCWKMILDNGLRQREQAPMRALVYNNLAWSELMMGSNSGQQESAFMHMMHAYRMMPWVPEIRGTRAAILIERGQLDEGIDEALQVVEDIRNLNDPAKSHNIAINLALAARGCYRQDSQSEAEEYLTEALMLAPDEYYVQIALKEIRNKSAPVASTNASVQEITY